MPMRTVPMRCAGLRALLPAVLLLLALPVGAAEPGDPLDCVEHPQRRPDHRPLLTLVTTLGRIDVELHPEAGPEAVRAVARFAAGPLFNPALVGGGDDADAGAADVGYYDGLAFEHTNPHVEIATAARRPARLFRVEPQLDAGALGLDQRRIADRGEAMDVLQRELLPEFTRNKKGGELTPLLRSWLDRWEESQDPGFLVGVSWQQVNEALGYVYRRGLDSRPPARGSVLLWPEAPTSATPRLSILLVDVPERTGRWMVVGTVAHGLDVAEAISSRPLAPVGRPRSYLPVNPVEIESASLHCRPRRSADTPEPANDD